ncbi:hypothetical protein, conserved [Trypanosoma brucei brucei TREU927]|uniref:Exocyst complex component Sec10-like alpha-helical bundle domain-containing protein n=1 Tax=Trypanosoma brucei brucei (strain 927/4 GUTat10.1) TaxID=185431 RepID=Q57XD1_TRYB2|nr:hypothetical protein, conserved [Trypanosoma brucei brucei TREU927]AAX69728.1 hypothetical protein, conserved [Trypanosoma brucei]AAZ13025.1 hypothetical protein, conserved [Trypanosoma brucei brucei TREU927]
MHIYMHILVVKVLRLMPNHGKSKAKGTEEKKARRRNSAVAKDDSANNVRSDRKVNDSVKSAPAPEQRLQLSLDRSVFSSSQFSAPTFVNNITNRVLFPLLMSRGWKEETAGGMKRFTENGVVGSTTTRADAEAGQAHGEEGSTGSDRGAVATSLTTTIAAALREIEKMQETEEQSLQLHEVRCRRLEIREKRKLATVRLGLEDTTARLHDYESRVCNAAAAIAGIEQHLAQSNARVLRGRSVSVLLNHFRMLTAIQKKDLTSALKGLKKARAEQREKITAQWKTCSVLPAETVYFDWDIDASARRGDGVGICSDYENGVKDRTMRDTYEGESRLSSRRHHTSISSRVHGQSGGTSREGLHHLEEAAIAAGLDRAFVVRSSTEAQVEWCQRLLHLRGELDGIVKNTANVDVYVNWLREELMNDIFHLVECFNGVHGELAEIAAQDPYGRTLLRTMEFVSRLYTTITTSHDALLLDFYSHTISQMCSSLFKDYSPEPLRVVPTFEKAKKGSSSSKASQEPVNQANTAMQHYRTSLEGCLRGAFSFFVSRARRDVIIVEAIFGTTYTARHHLLTQMTKGVVEPFLVNQMKLAEDHEREIREAESRLSPRSRNRAAAQMVDAITYKHTVQTELFVLFQEYVQEIRRTFTCGEADFLDKYVDSLFGTSRASYSEAELLRRHYSLLEESYAPKLRNVSGEVFDLRSEHMQMTKELVQCFVELSNRIRIYARPEDVRERMVELVETTLQQLGRVLEAELRKTVDFMRNSRDTWRSKPKNEEDILRNIDSEPQQCGLRMLLFAQSTMISLDDAIAASCDHLLQHEPQFVTTIEAKKVAAFQALDERAELLLNFCAHAIVVRSLSILLHFQHRNDYVPKVAKGGEGEVIAPPCTGACSLFCKYVAQEFERAKEFIKMSGGLASHRNTSPQAPAAEQLPPSSQFFSSGSMPSGQHMWSQNYCLYSSGVCSSGNMGSALGPTAQIDSPDGARQRARQMNLQQLLYGDGGASSFVRTVGVCLYRGISIHLKGFSVSDRGALVYKRDVTAYVEAMAPLTRVPGLDGAVIDVLFRLLKETASLLIMPPDHIKGVWDTGLLRLLSHDEKVQFVKMRVDLHDKFRDVVK